MYYTVLCISIKGLISMIHPHNLMIMTWIAPPPETDLNDLINFEEGAEDTFLTIEEGVSL